MLNTNHPRERLVNTAAQLVHRQGWTATGINQILSEANIPKGSFYYYFRSKEALGVAVLQLHATRLKQLLEKTLSNTQLSADAALSEFMAALTQMHRETEFRLGCAVGSFANEIATQSPALLNEANRALAFYEEAFLGLIQRGQRQGEIAPSIDPIETAKILTMLLQGGLLAMKCAGSASPLEMVHGMARGVLFGKAGLTVAPREAEISKVQLAS